MIEIPIWIFIMLAVVFSLSMGFIFILIVALIHDELIDFVKWKTNYKKYKEFWDDNPDLR